MKNVNELYEKYYSASKNDYDADDELSEDKEKNLTTNSLNQGITKMKSQK